MARREAKTDAAGPPPPPDWRALAAAAPHAEACAAWRELAAAGTLPPVLLLTGRDEDAALAPLLAALAAVHVCERGSGCGACEPCGWLLAGRHPEVLWLGGDERLLLEQAAQMQEHLALSPTPPSRWRIVCVPDIDRLSVQAANRLLKMLEEPPPMARIFGTTSRYGALLATIRSRCVRWRLQASLTAPPPSPGGDLDLAPLLTAAERGAAAILDAAEQLGRQSGVALPDLLDALEIALNQAYRRLARPDGEAFHVPVPGAAARLRRRQLIRQARRLARGGNVPLNAQLAAEALAFASIRGTT